MPPGSLLRHPVQVTALNYLETVLSVIPNATDRLESWFARPVVKPPATGLDERTNVLTIKHGVQTRDAARLIKQ